MNYFERFGIKEVADVTVFSITRIADEIIYTPVLNFDTLKVSSLSKSSDTVTAKGGPGNPTIISWSYTKDIKLKLEDALMSQSSMDLYLNGRFMTKHQPYTSLIMKLNIANKYGKKNYHPIAKPSPQLTQEEEAILFAAAQEAGVVMNPLFNINSTKYVFTNTNALNENWYVAENRKMLLEEYYKRSFQDYSHGSINKKINVAMSEDVIKAIFTKIDSLKKINGFKNDIYKTQVIDRMEKMVVTKPSGLKIFAKQQKENLCKYYADAKESFVIYYDPKTMQPFFGLDSNLNFSDDVFTLKRGTVCYKFSRTVDLIEVPDMIIGTELKINPETFPGEYKIVGETQVRNQRGEDHPMQFILNKVTISPTTNIELKADGAPSVFSLDINVLKPDNDDMVVLKEYQVENDEFYGGTRIVPQNSRHSYTPVVDDKIEEVESNDEFY